MQSPIMQARDHILKNCLPLVKENHTEMVIPCYARDEADFKAALDLAEVKSAIASLGVKVRLTVVDKQGIPGPEILIAPVEAALDGTLDRYLKKYE